MHGIRKCVNFNNAYVVDNVENTLYSVSSMIDYGFYGFSFFLSSTCFDSVFYALLQLEII